MTKSRPRTDKLERAVYALARLQQAEARSRSREKRREATRHYQLGRLLEGFLFEEPALLVRVEELIRKESPRVLAAFRIDRPPSWFEKPQRDDEKRAVDTRRFRLGMVLERILPGDAALLARSDAWMREQPPHVRDAFGLDDARHDPIGECDGVCACDGDGRNCTRNMCNHGTGRCEFQSVGGC